MKNAMQNEWVQIKGINRVRESWINPEIEMRVGIKETTMNQC